MTDDREDLLDEIGAALLIEPTPAFAARVRSEIESERVAPFWRPYALMAAAAAVVLVAAATVLLRPAAPASPPPTITDAPPSQPAMVVPMPRVSQSGRPAPAPAAAEAKRVVPTRARREPEVLVPPDQAEALRRLLAEVQAGRAVVPSARPRISEETGELLPLPELAEIAVPELRIDPLPGGEDVQETRGLDD